MSEKKNHHITLGNITRTLFFVPAILMAQPALAQFTPYTPGYISLNAMYEQARRNNNADDDKPLTAEQQEACISAMKELLQGTYSPEQISERSKQRLEALQNAWFLKGARIHSSERELAADEAQAAKLQKGVENHQCELNYSRFQQLPQKTK